MSIAIVIPVLNEAEIIVEALAALEPARAAGAEVVMVDGGSRDATAAIAASRGVTVITAPRGRATQMNAGAAATRAGVLLFLHADTRLPPDAVDLVTSGLKTSGRVWGRFDIRIAGASPLLPMVARMMNGRSRLSGIATGDQAIFVERKAFETIGGYGDLALMEDIDLSRRLKRLSPPLCLRATVETSGRRWNDNGVLRTVWLMWRLRLAYWLGADPDRLARRYGYVPR
jgi:rSAM/selenodomain-associated transferase 2